MEEPIKEIRPSSNATRSAKSNSESATTPRQLPAEKPSVSTGDTDRKSTGSAFSTINDKKQGEPAKSSTPGSKGSRASATGSKIGPYILGKTLGIGSTGILKQLTTGRVKIATHSETGQKVAVKIIPKQSRKKKEKEEDPNALNKKLEREIAIMKLIQHPNIMALYDVYETDEELYLILELVEGGELFDYLVKQGKLKELEALVFFQQILSGLDYCHKHLICHRDLKPENLLLDGNKKIKIADFGMASMQVVGKMLETSCGSPHYAAPEIIRGVKYDGSAADIWSCGVILFALLTGNLPFDDENIRRLLQKVKSGVYVIPDSVPKDAADLIRRMLIVNPAKRITLPEIQVHPWFLQLPYDPKRGGESPLRSPPSPESLLPLKPQEIACADPDILSSLTVLGYGTEDEIIKALLSSEPNYEKVFYWVLKQRKTEYLENYDPEQEWLNSDGKQLRRRVGSQGSRASLFTDRSSLSGSMYLSSSDVNSARNNNPPESPTDDKKDQPKKSSSDIQKRKSYNRSPLSAAVKPEDDEEFKPEMVQKAKEAALKALEGHRPPQQELPFDSLFASPAVESPKPSRGKRSSLFDQFKNKLNIHSSEQDAFQSLPSLEAKGNTNTQKNNDGSNNDLGTPKFHRKHLDLNIDVPNGATKTSNGAMSSSTPSLFIQKPYESGLPSPTHANTISKKSWFTNLFSFKPETFSLITTGNPLDIKHKIEDRLRSEGVDFQPSRDGTGIKCRFDDRGQSNPVKFRISLHIDDNGKIEITCSQQQGALSSFHRFAETFKKDFKT